MFNPCDMETGMVEIFESLRRLSHENKDLQYFWCGNLKPSYLDDFPRLLTLPAPDPEFLIELFKTDTDSVTILYHFWLV